MVIPTKMAATLKEIAEILSFIKYKINKEINAAQIVGIKIIMGVKKFLK